MYNNFLYNNSLDLFEFNTIGYQGGETFEIR